jgi:hypothetical protein
VKRGFEFNATLVRAYYLTGQKRRVMGRWPPSSDVCTWGRGIGIKLHSSDSRGAFEFLEQLAEKSYLILFKEYISSTTRTLEARTNHDVEQMIPRLDAILACQAILESPLTGPCTSGLWNLIPTMTHAKLTLSSPDGDPGTWMHLTARLEAVR